MSHDFRRRIHKAISLDIIKSLVRCRHHAVSLLVPSRSTFRPNLKIDFQDLRLTQL